MVGKLLGGYIVKIPSFNPCNNQILLIKGMLKFENHLIGGWQSLKQITDKEKTDKKEIEYKSQLYNFRNYMKPFLESGYVEERWHEYKDKRKRSHKIKQYRLNPNLKTYKMLNVIFGKEDKDRRYYLKNSDYKKLVANEVNIKELKDIERKQPSNDLFWVELLLDTLTLDEIERLESSIQKKKEEIKNNKEAKK